MRLPVSRFADKRAGSVDCIPKIISDGHIRELFMVQVIFYQIALAIYLLKLDNKIAKHVSLFITTTAAIAHAWYGYAPGERFVSWVNSKR